MRAHFSSTLQKSQSSSSWYKKLRIRIALLKLFTFCSLVLKVLEQDRKARQQQKLID